MRLVSDNTDDEIAKHHAELLLGSAFRDLTANLLRIVRGAGKPADLFRHLQLVQEAADAYRATCGHWPPSDSIRNHLDVRNEYEWGRFSDEEVSRTVAQDTVIMGALQVAASRLVGQLTQERRGETELFEGLRELERLREEQRRLYRARTKGAARQRTAASSAVKRARSRKGGKTPKV